jgi:hypothetical protein
VILETVGSFLKSGGGGAEVAPRGGLWLAGCWSKGHAPDLIWTTHLAMDGGRLWVVARQRPRGGAGRWRSPTVRR